ncbi:MAG: phosphoribosylformylglycinamidine synthase I [Candidatus Woesearchaeota archaeon]|jgi:phosphoribosylformylglycinamidine synthase|nr:phosphoribosylformylglycinamidine synthase I [Candidatus Woesearchaeota archaeon]
MTKSNIAVIMFPGNNCENETLRAAQAVGMTGKVLRWNTKEKLEDYDGYILPGGWAYEDRVRAGIIPALDPIMDTIKEQAKAGKPVLGICNGCQVLIETGMIPGIKDKVQMALAPNINPLVNGFYCTWVTIKNTGKPTAFTNRLEGEDIIPIPIAHGEGRFVTKDKDLLKELIKNEQIIFQYSDKEGNIDKNFPVNPNSSIENIAGISNKKGNVLGMMPHPERATWIRQLPEKPNKDMDSLAPAAGIFKSMKHSIEKSN